MSKIPILFLHHFKEENLLIKRILKSTKNLKNILPIEISPELLNNKSDLKKIMEKNLVKAAILPFNAKEEFNLIINNPNNLEWVQSCGTGVCHYRDYFKILKKKNITLTNSKGSSSILLAEFAILGALYFTKRAPFFLEKAKKKEWVDASDIMMDNMSGKNGIIIGFGSIGTEIAKKCYYGFNMKITGVKKNPKNFTSNQKEITSDIISLESLHNRISEMDYIFLALPNTNMEKKIITKDLIKKMKKGTIIVNVGRGDVVNENDLVWGLENSIIKGAALDVFEKEPLSKDSPLYDLNLQNKILNTCHKSDHSEHLFVKRVDIVSKNIERFLNGDKLENLVDLDNGY